MKLKYLPLAVLIISAASCSTAYKSGQTPDDVYYSPARVVEETAKRNYTERREDNYTYQDYEERQIRMAVRNRRYRDLAYDYDYNYRYSPYHYGYNYGYYYNPYYYSRPVYLPGYSIVNPKTTAPRTTNLGSYNNTNTVVVSDGKTGQTRWIQPSRTYNNSNSAGNNSSSGRRVILPTYDNSSNRSSSNNSSGNNNTRTYTPSSTPSSGSSSGSSSSGTTVSRPTRGN